MDNEINEPLKEALENCHTKDQALQVGIIGAIAGLQIPRRERIAIAAM